MFIEYLEEILENEKVAMGEYRFNCPFCGEEKAKFYVQSDEPFLWHCKHCDQAGNPIKFIMKYNRVGFDEAKEILRDFGYDVDNIGSSKFNEMYSEELTDSEKMLLAINHRNESEKEDSLKLDLKPIKPPYNVKLLSQNMDNPEALPYINYLYNRGLTEKDIHDYNIGYTPISKMTTPEGKSVMIYNSIVFFTFDDFGRMIYWNTRSIDKEAYIKSFNAPADKDEFSKDTSIFNLNIAKKTGTIVITEGVFNAITVGYSGVATFGKQVTEHQIQLLREVNDNNPCTNFVVFLDNDAYEQKEKLGKALSEFSDNVYIVSNPYKEKDANDIGRKETHKLISEARKYNYKNSLLAMFGV